MRPFTTEELAAFHDHLADMVSGGGERDALKYLAQHMKRLPEDLRQEILTRVFFDEVSQEAKEIEAIADAQQEGLAALAAIDAIKEALKEGN